MNDYKPAHRPVFGAIAVALTAVTIGLAVVLPAKVERVNAIGPQQGAEIAPLPVGAQAADADSGPIRIEVIARRDSTWMPVRTQLTAPKSRAQGSGRLDAHAVVAPEPLTGC